jgi:uncharacterized membrane protein
MTVLLPALLIGIIAGLRSMTAPAFVSWAARLGKLDLASSSLAFLGYAYTPWILTVLALAEFVADQLPTTPSRKSAGPFGTRIVTGALSGAAIGATGGLLVTGAIAGALGAVIGTLGGYAFRAWLAKALGNAHAAAFIEDVIAIGGACLIVGMVP